MESNNDKTQTPKIKFKIGIVVNQINLTTDIAYYKDSFKQINEYFKDSVSLIFIGHNPDLDVENILNGIVYEYTKPVSMVHYPKLLKSLNLNLLFVPLINSIYNASSEDTYKFLEAALFKIPIIAPNIYPYNSIIGDEFNGFIFKDKPAFFEKVKDIFENRRHTLVSCGHKAYEQAINDYNFSKKNVNILRQLFPVEEIILNEENDLQDF